MRRILVLLFVLLMLTAPVQAAFRPSTIGDVFNKGYSGHDVRAYGAKGDGSTDDAAAFTAAITAAAGGRLIIADCPTSYKLSSNVTVPAGITVEFQQGGLLSIDVSKTFTINGKIEAGLYQIFSGSGTAVFAKGSCNEVYPEWWGAVGDGVTDCTSAFNSALAAANNVGKLSIPAGTYIISSPVYGFPTDSISKMSTGITIEGVGTETVLKYTGVTGHCIEVKPLLDTASESPVGYTIQDLHMEAGSVADPVNGGCILLTGCYGQVNRVTIDNTGTGTGIHIRRRNVTVAESSFTTDTDRDFTTTGAGASEKYAIKFTSSTRTNYLKSVTVRLGATGVPAGTIHAEIWTNSGGLPNAQTGADSNTVDCNTLNTGADGAAQTFTWDSEDMPSISASTVYWLVLVTTGYTYTDGVTEVRLRVEAAGGAADSFGTYNYGVAWGTTADGANNTVLIRYRQAIQNRINDCGFYGSTRIGRGIWMEDFSFVNIVNSFFGATIGIYSDYSVLYGTGMYIYTTSYPLYMRESWTFISDSVIEGNNTACFFSGAKKRHRVANSWLSACHVDADPSTFYSQSNCYGDYMRSPDNPALLPDEWRYKIIPAVAGVWESSGAVLAADADALNGYAYQLDTQNEFARVQVYRATGIYGELPRGTYKVTLWLKDTNQITDDCRITSDYSSWLQDWYYEFTLTAEYRPYTMFLVIDATQSAITANGKRISVIKRYTNANTISISHAIWEYVGPDILSSEDLVAWASDESDADGGRKSNVYFYGAQSVSNLKVPLAQIESSHSGSSADYQGQLKIKINDGNDKLNALNVEVTIDEDKVVFAGDVTISGDDLKMATNTDTFLLVADGTEFSPVQMTGDVAITNAGVTAVSDDSHAHTTTTISGLDISADTNLAVTAPIVLTDDTLSLTLAKDIVAGTGLTGGEDNVLPGADADTTINIDTTWAATFASLNTTGEVISANEDFIPVSAIVPTGDGSSNATVDIRVADPTNRRLFNRTTGISDTQDMDWYSEKAVSQTPTSLTLWTRASDYANCVMTMTVSDQGGAADATGAVVITPTGNATWEEFTYTFTSTYTNDEELWIKIAVTSLDTADTADFGRIKVNY